MASTSKLNDKPNERTLGYLIKKSNHNHNAKKHCPPHDNESSKLPVCRYRDAFNRLIRDNQSLIVVGETGSGKTTQIPKWSKDFCMSLDRKLQVACTQPRRIAAMSVATRVAKELNVTLGQEVGYSVRFESCSSPQTKLKYLTDGMLLREAMLDGMLTSYGVIIIDEAHERTLQTEILLGIMKRAMLSRGKDNDKGLPPLKVVIMSATMNIKLFKGYFNCPILSIEGRQHPVEDMFAEITQSDLLTSTLTTVFQIHRTSDEGDILVFCSGQDEIQSLISLCKKVLKQAPESLQKLLPLPLYASLPAENQLRVFEWKPTPKTNGCSDGQSSQPSFTRRVIFATNVAETSITIPNIKYVIDTGKVKCRTYCPKTGFESLKITNISRAQAKQRSGRAGRIGPGTCYRLYTSEEFSKMNDYLAPEIRRTNLEGVLLQMISVGIKNINTFEFLERPDDIRIKSALNNLLILKAIKLTSTPTKSDDISSNETPKASDQTTSTQLSSPNKRKNYQPTSEDNIISHTCELTGLGRKMSVFPLTPAMSRIILAADDLGCLDEAITVISLLSVEDLFFIPPNKQSQAETILQKFHSNEGDIIMLLKVYRAFKRASQINRAGRKQWCVEHYINVKNLKLCGLIRKQLSDLCKSLNMTSSSCREDYSKIRQALTYGLFNNVATMWNGKYRNKSSNDIHIHPSSCLFKTRPESILYFEIVETNKCYMRNCTLIDMNWVRDISSSNLKT